jgi:hypothetical protein
MKPGQIIVIYVVIFVLAITAVAVISEISDAGTHGFAVPVPPDAIKYFQQWTKKQGDLSARVFG